MFFFTTKILKNYPLKKTSKFPSTYF